MRQSRNAAEAIASLAPWLDANPSGNPVAVVLGGTANGLSFARSLGRRGVPVLMLESEQFLGTYTRYARVLLLPSAREVPEMWLEFLELLGLRLLTRGVLLPTSDLHTLLVSRHRERLLHHFRFLVAEPATVECIVNKRLQYQHARMAGVPTPVTHFPETVMEASVVSKEVSYPCILKPYDSHSVRRKLAGRKLVVVRSSAELVSEYQRLTQMEVPLMVQEIIPGDDSKLYGYLAVWSSDGEELSWITKRKLRQFPPDFGDGSLQVTAHAPEVAQLSRSLLRSLSYSGFVSVEFKLDARDGSFRLMEINPRSVSGNQLAVSAGVDFAWVGYQYLCDKRPASSRNSGWRHVTLINEEFDLQSFLALRRLGRITIGAWLRSLLAVRSTAIWAWDDPMPLAVGLTRLVRRYLVRV